MFEYDELASSAAKVLDRYNFENELLQCRQDKLLSPYDIREHIGAGYNEEVKASFENLSEYELMDYLTLRYGIRWDEIISYRMI